VQAAVLNLVGVSHLFVVPRIRSSSYAEMLKEKLSDLPTLRNLVVVDNTGQFNQEADKLGLKDWIDWREIMVWDESSRENNLQKEISNSLQKDDVINLQFTRYSRSTIISDSLCSLHNNLQWYHRCSESSFGASSSLTRALVYS
jgi:predicted protein tyrosine phosphatase